MTGVSTNFRVSLRHRPDATVSLEIKRGIRIPQIPFTLRISDAALIKFNIALKWNFFFKDNFIQKKKDKTRKKRSWESWSRKVHGLTTELSIARILENELNGEAVTLRNIAIDVNNFPLLFLVALNGFYVIRANSVFFRSFISIDRIFYVTGLLT